MLARIYSIIFLVILIVGFVYQESYMQMTMSEFSQKIDADKLPVEILSVTPLNVHQYKQGQLVGEMSASEGRVVTTGRLTAQGNVEMRVIDDTAPPAERLSSITTEKLIASTTKSDGLSVDLFSGSAKLERVEIPGTANIASRGHVLVGKSFFLDVPTLKLVTREPVVVTARGRMIEALGLEAELKTRAFKLAGPVRGTEIPADRADQSENKKSKRQKKLNISE